MAFDVFDYGDSKSESKICFKRSVWELEKYKLKNLNLNVMHFSQEKSHYFWMLHVHEMYIYILVYIFVWDELQNKELEN